MAESDGAEGFSWRDVPVVNWFLPDPELPDGVDLERLPPLDWSGWSLQDKVAWTSQGSGAQAIDSTHGALNGLGTRFRDSDDAVRTQLDTVQVGWQGTASAAATASLTRVAAAGRAGGDASADGTVPVGTYGHSFDGLKNKFSYHESPLTSALGDWAPTARTVVMTTPMLAGFGVGDEMIKFGMNAEEGRRADDLLQAHEAAARQAVAGFPAPGQGSSLPGGAGSENPGGGGPGEAGTGAGGNGGGAGGAGGTPGELAPSAPVGPVPVGPGETGAPGPGEGGTGGSGGTGASTGGIVAPGAGDEGGTGTGRTDDRAPDTGSQGPTTPPVPTGPESSGGESSTGPRVTTPQGVAPMPDGMGPNTGGPSPFGTSPGTPTPSSPVPNAGYLPGPGPVPGSNGAGNPLGRTPGTPLPRSGADFGHGLVRNQPGGIPGSGGGRSGGWGGGEPVPRGGGGALGRYGGAGPSAEAVPGRGMSEPGAGRTGSGTHGVAPMGTGMGAGRGSDQEHRNRYLLPSSEAFDLDLPVTPPVLGGRDEPDGPGGPGDHEDGTR